MVIKPQTNRNLCEFSTFGIGGPIRFFLEIRTVDEALEAFFWAQKKGLETRVLGKGSNSLFRDDSFDGFVLLNKIDQCEIVGCEVNVGAGYSFSYLGVQSAKAALSGLEFASGIPASVGGAIWMNAGANGAETSDCLESVSYLFEQGEVHTFLKEELQFGYRTSSFQAMKGCILSARFVLQANESARLKQKSILQYRIQTQPLKDKSAGCIFRNPSKELSAGALIDRCGLKGVSVGDATVSSMHANFIINQGKAKASDVLSLIKHIQTTVFSHTGILLEPEIKIW